MAWRFFCPMCLRQYKVVEPPRRRLLKCQTCGKMIRLTFRISARVWPFYRRSRN